MTEQKKNLAWAVLSSSVRGRSEVIKVTTHEEADSLVAQSPDKFYKSGPIYIG